MFRGIYVFIAKLVIHFMFIDKLPILFEYFTHRFARRAPERSQPNERQSIALVGDAQDREPHRERQEGPGRVERAHQWTISPLIVPGPVTGLGGAGSGAVSHSQRSHILSAQYSCTDRFDSRIRGALLYRFQVRQVISGSAENARYIVESTLHWRTTNATGASTQPVTPQARRDVCVSKDVLDVCVGGCLD